MNNCRCFCSDVFDDDTESPALPVDAPVGLGCSVDAVLVKLARLSKIMLLFSSLFHPCKYSHILRFYSVRLSVLSVSVKTGSVRFRTIRSGILKYTFLPFH